MNYFLKLLPKHKTQNLNKKMSLGGAMRYKEKSGHILMEQTIEVCVIQS